MAIVLHQTLLTLEVCRVQLSPTLFYPCLTFVYIFIIIVIFIALGRLLHNWRMIIPPHFKRLNRNLSLLADWRQSSQPFSCVWMDEREKRTGFQCFQFVSSVDLSSFCETIPSVSVAFRCILPMHTKYTSSLNVLRSGFHISCLKKQQYYVTLLDLLLHLCGFLHGFLHFFCLRYKVTSVIRCCLILLLLTRI